MPSGNCVLITGGTGAVGPAVVRAFSTAGWTVRTLSRHAPAPGTPAADHAHIAGDIEDAGALASAMAGIDVVVHMAALLHVVDPPHGLESEYQRINVAGASAVIRAAQQENVRRVVHLSSAAVYGAREDVVDETIPPAPDTPYASSKLEAERLAIGAVGSDGAQLCSVLRLAAVYGPNVKGNYERLVRALARRQFVPVGTGANRRTLIFEDDVARAILLAAEHPKAAGQIFNVTDGGIHTVAEITTAICRALGRRPPLMRLPLSIAFRMAAASEVAFGALGRHSPLTRATLRKYTEHSAVSGQRFRNVLGFEPQYSLEEGWRRTVLDLRQAGRL